MPPVRGGYTILRVFPYIYPLPHPLSYDLSVVQSLEAFIYARTMTSEEPNPYHIMFCALADKKTGISLRSFRSNCPTCSKDVSQPSQDVCDPIYKQQLKIHVNKINK